MSLNRFPRQPFMALSRDEPHLTDLSNYVYDTQMINVIPKLSIPSLPHASPVTPYEAVGDFGFTVNNFAEKPSAFRSPKQNPTDSTCAFNKTASTNTITPSNLLEDYSPILRLPNFHEALRADEEMSSKNANATAKLQQMITQIAPITVKSTINSRSQRLLNLINTTVGPSASKDFPFNVPNLEKQALRYLKLTNDQITTQSNLHLQLIVAACCFLQYSQTQVDEVKIQDVDYVCKKLHIQSGKALSFLDKWEAARKEKCKQEEIAKSLNCPEEIGKKKNKETNATQLPEKKVEVALEEDFIDEVYVRNWQETNGNFLEKVLRETITKTVRQIDGIIQRRNPAEEQKFTETMLKPPTKAEIRELKEYRRQMNAKMSPGGNQWLARIRDEQQKANQLRRIASESYYGTDAKNYPSARITDCPPSLFEIRQWFIDIGMALDNLITDYNLLMACFWHSYKRSNLNKTSVSAIFYLITCQDLFEAEEPTVQSLLKGIGENRFRLRRKALIDMFGITEGMLHGALRKIKDSPPINRIKSKWSGRARMGTIDSSRNMAMMERMEPSVNGQQKLRVIRPSHGLPHIYSPRKENTPTTAKFIN